MTPNWSHSSDQGTSISSTQPLEGAVAVVFLPEENRKKPAGTCALNKLLFRISFTRNISSTVSTTAFFFCCFMWWKICRLYAALILVQHYGTMKAGVFLSTWVHMQANVQWGVNVLTMLLMFSMKTGRGTVIECRKCKITLIVCLEKWSEKLKSLCSLQLIG